RADAGSGEGAGVGHGAGIAIGAGGSGGEARGGTCPRPVAGEARADRRAGAGRARRLEGAGRRAAVAGDLVAVVALLTRGEDAVAGDVDLLASDHEEVGLCAAERQGTVDAEDVGAAGAPGYGVGRDAVTDEAGRRRGGRRVPLQEAGPDTAPR